MSLALGLPAALLLYKSFDLVQDASRGNRWITLKRRSLLSVDAVVANLERHWRDDALTFQPVRIARESSESRKAFHAEIKGMRHDTVIERLPSDDRCEIAVTCLRANGVAFPVGRQHRKIWTVRQTPSGSEISVAVRLTVPISAIPGLLHSFRKQLRLAARGQ